MPDFPRRARGLPALGLLVILAGCPDTQTPGSADAAQVPRPEPTIRGGEPPPGYEPDQRYVELRRKVTYGKATMAEVREALTDPDIGALTNTVLALYSMRWHRGVYNLLQRMWEGDSTHFEELQWEQFAKAPVRLALATTLLRIHLMDNEPYVTYLRAHRYDEHEFHRAQVVVGLGFKGDADDVGYLKEMAAGDNAFVAQSAITALGLMERPQAKAALIAVLEDNLDDPRARIIREVLAYAYGEKDEDAKPSRAPPPAPGRVPTPEGGAPGDAVEPDFPGEQAGAGESGEPARASD